MPQNVAADVEIPGGSRYRVSESQTTFNTDGMTTKRKSTGVFCVSTVRLRSPGGGGAVKGTTAGFQLKKRHRRDEDAGAAGRDPKAAVGGSCSCPPH